MDLTTLVPVFFFACCTVWGLPEAQYELTKYQGQFIEDTTGNGYHGVSGTVLAIDGSDAVFTDRGAYLDGGCLTLPSSEVSSLALILPDQFTITVWAYSLGMPFGLASKQGTTVLEAFHDGVDLFCATAQELDSCTPGKPLSWGFYSVLVFLSNGVSTLQVEYNTQSSVAVAVDWTDSESVLLIGGDPTSPFVGFVYEVSVYFSKELQSSLSWFVSSTCLTPLSSEICLSEVTDPLQNSDGITCSCESYSCTTSMSCIQCSANCLACSSGRLCLICDTSTFLQPDSTCLASCPESYYGVNSVCYPCHQDCLTCSGPSSNECTQCRLTSATLVGQECSCIDGYYEETTNPLNCVACAGDCSLCDATGCTQCIDPNAILVNGNCECLTGFYKDSFGACIPCHSDCVTCIGPTSTDCTSCVQEFTQVDEVTELCECIDGYYWDGSGCLECNEGCLQCSSLECSECESGRVLADGRCYLLVELELTLLANNTVEVSLQESLTLQAELLNLEAAGHTVDFTCVLTNALTYLLVTKYAPAEIESDTTLTVSVTDFVYGSSVVIGPGTYELTLNPTVEKKVLRSLKSSALRHYVEH